MQKNRTWLSNKITNKIFKDELIPILQLFPKIEDDEILSNSLYEGSITLILKSDKNPSKKIITGQYSWWTERLYPQQNISKPNSATHWKDHAPESSGIYLWDAKTVQLHKSINVIHHMCVLSHSVMSTSLQPMGLLPIRLFCP